MFQKDLQTELSTKIDQVAFVNATNSSFMVFVCVGVTPVMFSNSAFTTSLWSPKLWLVFLCEFTIDMMERSGGKSYKRVCKAEDGSTIPRGPVLIFSIFQNF